MTTPEDEGPEPNEASEDPAGKRKRKITKATLEDLELPPDADVTGGASTRDPNDPLTLVTVR